jgi:hypothetical protein
LLRNKVSNKVYGRRYPKRCRGDKGKEQAGGDGQSLGNESHPENPDCGSDLCRHRAILVLCRFPKTLCQRDRSDNRFSAFDFVDFGCEEDLDETFSREIIYETFINISRVKERKFEEVFCRAI